MPSLDPERFVKLCSKCGELKPLKAFNRNRTKALGRASQCRDCARIARAEAGMRADRFRFQAAIESTLSTDPPAVVSPDVGLPSSTQHHSKPPGVTCCAVLGCREPAIFHHLSYDPPILVPLCPDHHAAVHAFQNLVRRLAEHFGIDGADQLPSSIEPAPSAPDASSFSRFPPELDWQAHPRRRRRNTPDDDEDAPLTHCQLSAEASWRPDPID